MSTDNDLALFLERERATAYYNRYERGFNAMMFAIKVETKHDANGNPRRGWLVYDRPGSCINFVEEGYAGERALRLAHPAFGPLDASGTPGPAVVTCVLEITGGEWQRIRRAQRTREQWKKEEDQ